MMLVTYLPRALPMLVLSRFQLPIRLRLWLEFVPVAIMSALVMPELLAPKGSLLLSAQNPYLLAAVPAMLVSWRTRNLALTVVAGMFTFWLLSLHLF